MKIKDILPWASLVITLLFAGTAFYKTIITSQMLAAQNQRQVESVGQILEGVVEKQIELQMWKLEVENRLHDLEGETNGD